jgi:hypothetical protein
LSGAGTAGAGVLALGDNPRVTTVSLGNGVNAAAKTINIASAASITQANTVNLLSGATPGADQTLNIMAGAGTAGTYTVNVLGTGATRAGTINLGTGAAVHVINMLASTGTLGFFGTTAAVQQTQGAITNNVTSGGSTGTIADFTDLMVYANDAATIRNDIYQLALGLQGAIAALRAYGLCK